MKKTVRGLSLILAFIFVLSFSVPVFASDDDLNTETGTYTVPEGTETVKNGTVYLSGKSYSDIRKIVIPSTVKTIKAGAFNPERFTSLKKIEINSRKGDVDFESGALPQNDPSYEGITVSYRTAAPAVNPDLKPSEKRDEKPAAKKNKETLPETITGNVRKVRRRDNHPQKEPEKLEKNVSEPEMMVSEGTKSGNIFSTVITAVVAASFIFLGILKFRPATSY